MNDDILRNEKGLLRFLTAGSVDDGKSTLIGRLLVDTKGVYEDQYAAAQEHARRKGADGAELALLTDGLQTERDQGITIDVAYRYFATPKRKFIIADAPGHEQYTRNMVTAASTAELAVLLIDARRGVTTQSRRHAYIAHLLGIPQLFVAVNKMDMVDYGNDVFQAVVDEMETFCLSLNFEDERFFPISALRGDMIVQRGDNMPWYGGETLLEALENVPTIDNCQQPLRFPVQVVSRPQTPKLPDFRGYMGRVESGRVRRGDEIQVLPSGFRTRVSAIVGWQGELDEASLHQSVTLVLKDEIDIARGDMLAAPESGYQTGRELEAMLCWMDLQPMRIGATYLLRHTTNTVRAVVRKIEYSVDVNTLQQHTLQEHGGLDLNEIAYVRITLQQAVAFDDYRKNRATGGFILIDADTNNTVAMGMIHITTVQDKATMDPRTGER